MSLSEEFQNMRVHRGRRSSPLSVDDLSDHGAPPARNVSSSKAKNVDQARVFVQALKDFILPIVHAQVPRLAAIQKEKINDNTESARLGPAAQQLVDALENFIASLVSPEEIRKDGAQSEEVNNLRENTGLIPSTQPAVDRTQSKSLILGSKASERPRLLTLALDEARYRVFNKMPIRLLTFKSDGAGIQLLDRSATWDYVSTLIEAEFDEVQINEDIKRRNYPLYNPGAEKGAIEHYISQYTGYSILSHTWLRDRPGEVTYDDWKGGNVDTDSLGYQKLANFCRIAATDYGNTLAWMDTICINKESSAELDESIRSMYNWYRDASICITYLAQTTTLAHMHNDAWFTRGWTLQELLAPRYIKFYGADWQKLNSDVQNDKQNYLIQTKILAATTITQVELNNNLSTIYVSRKMQWAANRQVTREEDTAYSLMGIFNVSLSIAYGEGAERAFFRLAQQILDSKQAGLDIINWGYGPELTHNSDNTRVSSLIPSRPQQYLWRAAKFFTWPFPSIPVTLTHLGLHLSVLLMPAISTSDPNLHPFYSIGDYYSSVTIDEAVADPNAQTFFSPGQSYNVLDMASRHNTDNTDAYRHRITFGVLNFGTDESWVNFPNIDGFRITCFAVVLSFNISAYSSLANAAAAKRVHVLRTRTAIAFDLHSRQRMSSPLPNWSSILKGDLARHGMQLLDMYL